jgi:hypothetical protein
MVAPAIVRPADGVVIAAYNWLVCEARGGGGGVVARWAAPRVSRRRWTEVQHGSNVFSATPATSGPASGTLACSWSPPAFAAAAAVYGAEARGSHNAAVAAGVRLTDQASWR